MLEKNTDLSLNPVGKNNRLGNYLESTMIYDKLFLKPKIKQLTGRRRNWAKANGLILTGRNKNDAHECAKYLGMLKISIFRGWRLVRAKKIGKGSAEKLTKMYKILFHRLLTDLTLPFDVAEVDLGMVQRGESATIDGWEELRIPEDLRVHTRDDLWSLYRGFQFRDRYVSKGRNVFSGEEVFLFGLYRLSHTGKYNQMDVQQLFGFHNGGICAKCFHCFLSFMVNSWGYLLTNNVEYWKEHLASCAKAIADKCGSLGCEFPDGAFNIFAFVDNTMNATCRPGGGPTRDGVGAPRNDPLLQQAWYNGWKKLHGMKWQTVDLPNGMNFHCWGPFSVRHNDLYSFRHSNINTLIAGMQADELLQFRIYGDSAYTILSYSHVRARHNYERNTPREILENKAMSSCRETIEWDYGDIGRYFPLLDFKEGLKMRRMPIGAMCLSAMILRNALNTLRPNQTSQYFHLNPPSLSDWLQQGPNKRPNVEAIVNLRDD